MSTPIPDGEKIVGDYLRGKGFRVVGKTPDESERDTSWVRLTQLDAINRTNAKPEHLVEFYFQCDCYAGKDGGQPEAISLGRIVRQALTDLEGVQSGGASVTATIITSDARIPDPEFKPPRERKIIDASIYIHG